MARRIFAGVLILVAAVLLVAGAYLALLGGSPYYAAAGLLIGASGVLAWRGDGRSAWLYGAMLALTIVFAIYESGGDGWALTARLVAPVVLGLGFVWMRRPTARGALYASAIALACVPIGIVANRLGPQDYPDPLFQAGRIPAEQALAAVSRLADDPAGDWVNYGNDPGGSRYSALDQISPRNVGKLAVAWEFHVGKGEARSLEVTPIKIGDAIYVCTSNNDVIALDAETGRQRWRFHSGINLAGRPSANCRGVAYYRVPEMTGPCAERILTNTVDARLIALDKTTGTPCADFGLNGEVDLTVGMGHVDVGYYYVSSAPTVVRDKVVLGGWVSDGQYWGEPSGVIRAFDARSGKLSWAFDMGRPDRSGAPAMGETYTHSTPNSWAPMSADPELGLVYAPVGHATPDYYGAQRRPFDDQYSSSVVALDVATGRPRWTFQTTHHDLWDYDVASQPTLIDLPQGGRIVKALVQPTKRGEIFLLDRLSGKPLAAVEERKVPQGGGAPGDRLSPTQPFSVGMPSFAGARWRERDMWGLTPLDQLWCRIKFREARYEGTMTPPGLTPNITEPGYLGGVDWGGVSVDRERGLLIVNSNRLGNYNVLVSRKQALADGAKRSVAGSPRAVDGVVAQENTPFAAQIKPFLSPLGAPCNEPPYGHVSVVDLKSHKLVWSRRLGTARDSGPWGLASHLPITMGVPNAGGALTTRSGLIFIAATQERTMRALDLASGRELWSARLPAGGQASPMTYLSPRSGRQFIVIAAGGNLGLRSQLGDSVVAFAVPK
jgi:quinoprotein glucose dehydrogenase